MKAIIIAAGSGKRISKNFGSIPKSLIPVNGKSIISKQISTFHSFGIEEIIVITGPFNEKFTLSNVQYVHDENYSKHDILGSLMTAKKFLSGEVIITYSDILFEDSILEKILNSNSDIGITIDLDWKKQYENRTLHPISEAENVLLDNSGKITQIKKNIQTSNSAIGEFLGIMKLTDKGCKKLLEHYEKNLDGNGVFHDAESINNAYLTDMIQELIESNVEISPILISGKWCEIDTIEDLEHAEKLF